MFVTFESADHWTGTLYGRFGTTLGPVNLSVLAEHGHANGLKLSSLTGAFSYPLADITAELSAIGTFGDPLLDFQGATLTIVKALEHFNLSLAVPFLDGQGLSVSKFNARLGKGPLKRAPASSWCRPAPDSRWPRWAPPLRR